MDGRQAWLIQCPHCGKPLWLHLGEAKVKRVREIEAGETLKMPELRAWATGDVVLHCGCPSWGCLVLQTAVELEELRDRSDNFARGS